MSDEQAFAGQRGGERGQQALVSEAVRGEGAILYDAAGERVTDGWAKRSRHFDDLDDPSTLGAEAVLGMRLNQLTKAERRKNQAELDDLNSTLTFTLAERPASSGDTLEVRVFCADDADIFAVRTEELKVAGDGSGEPAGPLADEIAKGAQRVDDEDAVWLVAEEEGIKVGLIFGELSDGEVDVRIWIHPDKRKQGYGVAALRKSRSEMASLFPGVPMVVRGPSS